MLRADEGLTLLCWVPFERRLTLPASFSNKVPGYSLGHVIFFAFLLVCNLFIFIYSVRVGAKQPPAVYCAGITAQRVSCSKLGVAFYPSCETLLGLRLPHCPCVQRWHCHTGRSLGSRKASLSTPFLKSNFLRKMFQINSGRHNNVQYAI